MVRSSELVMPRYMLISVTSMQSITSLSQLLSVGRYPDNRALLWMKNNCSGLLLDFLGLQILLEEFRFLLDSAKRYLSECLKYLTGY